MSIFDRFFKDVDVIKTGKAVNKISYIMLYMFLVVIIMNIMLILNYVFLQIDLCGPFIPLYNGMHLPIRASKLNIPSERAVFCQIEIGVRLVSMIYVLIFVAFSISIYAANRYEKNSAGIKLLIFFSVWWILGISVLYMEGPFDSFYGQFSIRYIFNAICMLMLFPFLFFVLSAGLRRGDSFRIGR